MTDRTSAFDVLAAVSAAMLDEDHPADVLANLMQACMGPLSADSAAILVAESDGALSLLTASSHHAEQIELLQTQQSRGPCVDAITSGEHVFAVGAAVLVERWGDVGAAIRNAGFASAHAFPMRWHGQVLGGLNIFRVTDDGDSAEDTAVIGQAFADVATLVLVQVHELSADQLGDRVRETLAARSAVEQAKGVLAYLHGTDPESAYAELARLAAADHGSLTETARQVLRDQHR
jgi:GAF domain-containing protein